MIKNKKIILGIGILTIIGIILISGCLNNKTISYLPSYPEYIPSNSTLTPLQICEKITEKDVKDMCFASINEYDKIEDENFRNYYLAIKTNNASLCENISSSLKLDCYEKLVGEKGLIKHIDPSICETGGYGCYFKLARISGNISVCDKMKWLKHGEMPDTKELEYEKEECYLIIAEKTGNASVCGDRIKDRERKDRCFGEVCVKTADERYCEKIKDQVFKDMFKEMYYEVLAEKQNDTSYCEKIKDSNSKEACIVYTKYPNMSYIEHCEEMKTHEMRGQCYLDLAINKSDASLCDKVINKYEKNYCYLTIAEETKNEKLCEKINDRKTRDFCYFIIGVKKDNATLCENIEGYQCKAGCLGITKNPKYCYEIRSPIKMRGYCLVDAATKNMDVEICNFNCTADNCYHNNRCYSAVAKSIYDHKNNITNTEDYDYYDYETYLC